MAYFGSPFSVQRFAIAHSGSATTNQTISAVDLSKSFVAFSGWKDADSTTISGLPPTQIFVGAHLTSTTNVAVESGSGTNISATVYLEIVTGA
jgi:hypothetical protein